MSGIMDRIRTFARGPQGRRLLDQGKRMASDPRKRAQAKEALAKLRAKR